ncbi:hypothetical protein BJ165DRAFT_1406932 [Panaeolus papilionaceus]|nr:hypothetical protein BJ165DRAFT_1406932 [Panaeolus papilionaceus]
MSSSIFSEHLILSSCNPHMKIGPFDGKVASHIATNPDLHQICMTPNQDMVPYPPYTTVRSLRVRADLRYSRHDHTLFLQPYVAFYSHLGAIPRKPTNTNHPLTIMWWDPTPNDFVALTGGILLGTGSLATNLLNVFRAMEQQLQHTLDLIATIATALSNALIRLSSLKTLYMQMRFTVTEFQQYYLELVGLLDYMEIYQPRMQGWLPAASTVDDHVGVFTLNETVVQDFYRAGLPVWYLHPWKGGPFDRNVLQIVSPTQSDARMDDYDPPFPTIYTGLLGGREVLDTIHHFSRNWLSCKDPFQGNGVQVNPPGKISTSWKSIYIKHSMPVPAPSSLPRPEGSNSKQSMKPRTGKPRIEGRNKYAPLKSNLAPFSIPAWAQGLAAVNTSFSNLVEQTKTTSLLGHYVFPDPAHFVTPKSDGKKAILLTTWLLCHDAWLACVTSRDNLALPMQGWCDILFMDFTTPPSLGDTKASARQAEALERFKPETLQAFCNDLQYATGQPMRWNHTSYPPYCRTCVGLDLNDVTAVYKWEIIIMRCFPFLMYKQPAQPMPTRNQGLAADDPSERLTHLLQLAKLMSSWSGEKPDILKLHERKSQDSIS